MIYYNVMVLVPIGPKIIKSTRDVKIATDLLNKFPGHNIWLEIKVS